ncbi:hypothetical protein ACYZT4_11020 [Pseudomonas sp. GB2N2]
MTNYLIKTRDGELHLVTASTYVQDANGLRFVGDAGTTRGLFPQFEWMKVKDDEAVVVPGQANPVASSEPAASSSPELAGE